MKISVTVTMITVTTITSTMITVTVTKITAKMVINNGYWNLNKVIH